MMGLSEISIFGAVLWTVALTEIKGVRDVIGYNWVPKR